MHQPKLPRMSGERRKYHCRHKRQRIYWPNYSKELALQERIPSLDGWRGIAILMVLLLHYGPLAIPFGYLRGMGAGVTVFFVLSGYLITNNFLERGVNLKTFYARRFFRLMPVAWFYLLFLALLQYMAHPPAVINAGSIPALLFYRNFSGVESLRTMHFWSLSVEEQFYLVWPAIFLLCGRKKALYVAIIASVACATYRYMNWASYAPFPRPAETQVTADSLLIGCALAIVLSTPRGKATMLKSIPYIFPLSLATFVYFVCKGPALIPMTESLSIAALIGTSVLQPNRLFARILSFAPLVWIGLISYSLYVWQELFAPPGLISHSSWFFIAIIASACFSYYCIEKPMTRLGRRLTGASGEGRHKVPSPHTSLGLKNLQPQ